MRWLRQKRYQQLIPIALRAKVMITIATKATAILVIEWVVKSEDWTI